MGSAIGSIFGIKQPSYDPPAPVQAESDPVPVREAEAEPEAKTTRDAERRKIKSRRAMSGTLLTSPLGTTSTASSLLGQKLM